MKRLKCLYFTLTAICLSSNVSAKPLTSYLKNLKNLTGKYTKLKFNHFYERPDLSENKELSDAFNSYKQALRNDSSAIEETKGAIESILERSRELIAENRKRLKERLDLDTAIVTTLHNNIRLNIIKEIETIIIRLRFEGRKDQDPINDKDQDPVSDEAAFEAKLLAIKLASPFAHELISLPNLLENQLVKRIFEHYNKMIDSIILEDSNELLSDQMTNKALLTFKELDSLFSSDRNLRYEKGEELRSQMEKKFKDLVARFSKI